MIPPLTAIPALLLSMLLVARCAQAAPGELDPTFDSGSGLNGRVLYILPQPDGKILITGAFTTIRDVNRHGFARLNADGSGDASFNAGAYSAAGQVARQADGKLLVVAASGLHRLLPNGELDVSFKHPLEGRCGDYPSLWCHHGVSAVFVQPDGRILVGGFFQVTVGSKINYGLARLHPDGQLDPSFNATLPDPDPVTGLIGGIDAIAVRADGKIWVAGTFVSINGVPRHNVARLHADGRLDASFNPAGTIDGHVDHIISQPDGKLLVLGEFTTANRANRGFARLNGNGSPDVAFNAATEIYGKGTGVVLLPDRKILLAFLAGSLQRPGKRLVRLLPDGQADPLFDSDAGSEAGSVIECLAVQPDGKILAGGHIISPDDIRPYGLVRLERDGSPDASFSADRSLSGIAGGTILNMALRPDGRVLVAGTAVHIDRSHRQGVAQLDPDGRVDDSFTAGAGMDGVVNAVALESDGAVLIGGDFFEPTGFESRPLARLFEDGTLDPAFNPGVEALVSVDDCPRNAAQFGYTCSTAHEVTALDVQADGRIVIAGFRRTFVCTQDGGCLVVWRHFVGRFHPDGSRDEVFIPEGIRDIGADDIIGSLEARPDGTVLLAGRFGAVNGVARNGVARLRANGTLDDGFVPMPGFLKATSIDAMTVQADGKVVLAGTFADPEDGLRSLIIRLMPDGALDSGFAPFESLQGTVHGLVVQPDGRLLAAGEFSLTRPDGTTQRHLARLHPNGTLDSTFVIEQGPDDVVFALARQPDGAVLIGGLFSAVEGVTRRRIARYYGQSPPPPLRIHPEGGHLALSWPETGASFALQRTASLIPPVRWSAVAADPASEAGRSVLRLPLDAPQSFFRLSTLPAGQ